MVRRLIPSPRALRIALVVLVVLLGTGVLLDRGLDRPLRRIIEQRINASLVGYTARVGYVNFHLLGLSLDLEDLLVVQDEHPAPPVIDVPRMEMSVHWRDLLYLRLVADAFFDSPTIHANLVQLREEHRDGVPLSDRGWQRALESIYPLKINELRIVNGTLTYQDDSGSKPLQASGIEVLAGNIRNIRSRERQYPSNVHAEGWVFDVGRAMFEGHADFLAEPTPGVKGRVDLEHVELSYFEPIVRRFGFTVRQGFVAASGEIEVAPRFQSVDIGSVVITAAVVDYFHDAVPTPQARAAGSAISRVARDAMENPEVLYRVRHMLIDDGTLGIVNGVEHPPYRLYFSNADFELSNVSSRVEDGPAKATLRGAFMGSGSVDGSAAFHPQGKDANFEGKLSIENTQLESLNGLLRTQGKFDVVGGTFSLYSEVKVQGGYIDGYVKPLFRDVNVYDAEQDKGKNVFRKMYEGIVGGVAKLLENRRDEVVTVVSLKGPVDDTHSSTFQVVVGLVRNAFVQAILPGFERELEGLDPLKYRAIKRRERKEQRASLER
jgi:hypothetical protein